MYKNRFYRETSNNGRFKHTEIQVGESGIWIGWNSPDEKISPSVISAEAQKIITGLRKQITDYAIACPEFITSLEPVSVKSGAAEIVKTMAETARPAGVGPMASVAGALAESLGKSLDRLYGFDEIIIENGGDFWMKTVNPLSVGVYAGLSSLSGKIAVILEPGIWGLACSSGTVGPSLSYGKADASLVIARDAAAADAWATALGNRVKRQDDMADALAWLLDEIPANVPGESYRPLGALIVMGDTMAARGNITLGSAPN